MDSRTTSGFLDDSEANGRVPVPARLTASNLNLLNQSLPIWRIPDDAASQSSRASSRILDNVSVRTESTLGSRRQHDWLRKKDLRDLVDLDKRPGGM